jgi:hypothetical protein
MHIYRLGFEVGNLDGAAGDSGKLRFVQSEILSITPLIKPELRKTIEP